MTDGAARSFLSSSELHEIEAQLAKFSSEPNVDLVQLRRTIDIQIKELRKLSSDRRFRDAIDKIEALFEAAPRDNAEGRAARSALLYLAEANDVVSDNLGVVGLLDDMYVVDWAYAAISQQTRCLPIINSLLDRWPFVADLAVVGSPPLQIDPYSQYVACAALRSLFENSGFSVLVLRENAGYPAICALMAAIQCAKLQADGLQQEFLAWPIGTPVKIGDGSDQFRATYSGSTTVAGRQKIWLGVRNNGRLTINMDMVPYIARAESTARSLSDGATISSWLKQRHVDPLVLLTGTNRKRLERQDAVLLIGPRHKLESYFSALCPFGGSVEGLLGAKYINSERVASDIGSAASDTPFIYACSDLETAVDLINSPPSHVSRWRVLVDGAKHGNAIFGALDRSGKDLAASICIFAELHEREAGKELGKRDVPLWYLEAHDVQAPSIGVLKGGVDELSLSIRRQGQYYYQTTRIVEVRDNFLEGVAESLRSDRRDRDEAPELGALDIQVSHFLKKATAFPLKNDAARDELAKAARNIVSNASVIASYHTRARKTMDAFKAFCERPHFFDREATLIRAIEGRKERGVTAIVCRSERVVESCRSSAERMNSFKSVAWTTMEELRRFSPVSHLIVPGWLDRMAMREIANNGYAEDVSLVLLPFEQRWLNSTLDANRRWERRLEAKTAAVLRNLSSRDGGNKDRLWLKQSEERIQMGGAIDAMEIDDNDLEGIEIDRLEAREIAIIEEQAVRERIGHDVARAQLVLFEEDGTFAYLPPDGRVIALKENAESPPAKKLNQRDAEAQLFRKVSELRPGIVLAFSRGGDRDLVDARADQFMERAERIRNSANRWKMALKRFLKPNWNDYVAFAQKLSEMGEGRDPSTIRAWATRTSSVAPMNFRKVVPLIAKITGDQDLQRNMVGTLEAIDLIYRARALAAEAIVNELFSGEINLQESHLVFTVGDTRMVYDLFRIRAVANIEKVAVEQIGKVKRLGDIAGSAPLSSGLH